jgi:hypothetical protein
LKYYKKNILNPLPKKEEDIHIEWSKKQQRVSSYELETEQAEYFVYQLMIPSNGRKHPDKDDRTLPV